MEREQLEKRRAELLNQQARLLESAKRELNLLEGRIVEIEHLLMLTPPPPTEQDDVHGKTA